MAGRRVAGAGKVDAAAVDRPAGCMAVAAVFPQAAQRMLSLMRNPRASTAQVVQAACLDPGTAGLLMQLANSVLFGARAPIATLSAAIARLGFYRPESNRDGGHAAGVRLRQAGRGVATLRAGGRPFRAIGGARRRRRSRGSLPGRFAARASLYACLGEHTAAAAPVSVSRHTSHRDPYILFAASNLKLCRPASYPLWIEPDFTLPGQAWLWFAAYVLLWVLTAFCFPRAVWSARGSMREVPSVAETSSPRTLSSSRQGTPNSRSRMSLSGTFFHSVI